MAVMVGDPVSADLLNRLRDAEYRAKASGTVAASSTNTDVPGATVTFDVIEDGATIEVSWTADFDPSGAPSGTNQVRALIDGTTASPVNAVWSTGLSETSAGRWGGVSAFYETTLDAGNHTIKLQATLGTNIICQVFTTLKVKVREVI